MIETLMERVSTVEKEKADLAGQYEKYATLSDDIANYKKRMNEMSLILDAKEKAIEKEKSDKESIEHSQEELLKKMKDLQKENDNLVVKLEGLKTENDGLITKNKKLEDRIKVLEDENKQQLQKINEALSLPVPIVLDRETVKERSLKELQKLESFREKVTSSSVDICNNRRLSNSSGQLSSSPPPSLTIPTVNFSDEKRPASSQKELKIIPKIVEPSTSSTDASASVKTKEKEYTSTINSQVAPTIPHDSPLHGTSKTFAETFSRSCNKISRTLKQLFSIIFL
jgi:DNA repair exonuclease SbcCD ATPase subunit